MDFPSESLPSIPSGGRRGAKEDENAQGDELTGKEEKTPYASYTSHTNEI